MTRDPTSKVIQNLIFLKLKNLYTKSILVVKPEPVFIYVVRVRGKPTSHNMESESLSTSSF